MILLLNAPLNQDLVDELKKALKDGMESNPFEEGHVDVIEIGSEDTSTLMVSIPSLSGKVCQTIYISVSSSTLIKAYISTPVATPLMLPYVTHIGHPGFIGTEATP
jgi:hypothetical protein